MAGGGIGDQAGIARGEPCGEEVWLEFAKESFIGVEAALEIFEHGEDRV